MRKSFAIMMAEYCYRGDDWRIRIGRFSTLAALLVNGAIFDRYSTGVLDHIQVDWWHRRCGKTGAKRNCLQFAKGLLPVWSIWNPKTELYSH